MSFQEKKRSTLGNQKSLQTILVKPSGPDCNMACRYCFYREKAKLFPDTPKHRMGKDVLSEMIRQLFSQGTDHLSICWQGGEPTLMGLPFFEDAVEFEKRYGQGKAVGNSFQTNGLLLDKDWANFFKKYSFLIGLSLDGTEHIHDHYRLTRGGKGSFREVHGRTKMLLDMGVDVNALSVITDYSVRFPEEIYQFLKVLGFSFMQFIPCMETCSVNPKEAAPFSVKADEYGDFLCKIFDLWRADFVQGKPVTSIRFFESLLHSYAGLVPTECTLLSQCGSYVVVEHNGDVYSCDFFVDPEWKLGNIRQDNLISLLNSEKQRKFGMMKQDLSSDCHKCDWLFPCQGGCVKDRIRGPHDTNVNHFCLAYRKFFLHADKTLRQLVAEFQKENSTPAIKIRRNSPCPCQSGKKSKHCCHKRTLQT